jgi:hypothetical protein
MPFYSIKTLLEWGLGLIYYDFFYGPGLGPPSPSGTPVTPGLLRTP